MKADWDQHAGSAGWSDFVLDAVRASTLEQAQPADSAAFWAGYAAADAQGRQQFWLMLISAIAKMESNFDPNTVYGEPPPLNQNSIGLMQLSKTDTSYGCDFPTEESIKNPKRNLSCAVRILDRLIHRDDRIGGDKDHRKKGGAAYWSTLRVPKPGKRDARAYVISRTSVL